MPPSLGTLGCAEPSRGDLGMFGVVWSGFGWTWRGLCVFRVGLSGFGFF